MVITYLTLPILSTEKRPAAGVYEMATPPPPSLIRHNQTFAGFVGGGEDDSGYRAAIG